MIERVAKEVEMIERHLELLLRVIEHEPIGIVKLSNQSGHAHHKVRYSLRVLEEEGLVEPSQQGAITTERTVEFVNDIDEQLATLADRLEAMKINDRAERNTHGL